MSFDISLLALLLFIVPVLYLLVSNLNVAQARWLGQKQGGARRGRGKGTRLAVRTRIPTSESDIMHHGSGASRAHYTWSVHPSLHTAEDRGQKIEAKH
ncbi:hypothetical protein EI94DRAFT_996330 [Lactarius quietus]|nr:hypothetical protein EI94DRAFT_996330 [Lactarius quietus]